MTRAEFLAGARQLGATVIEIAGAVHIVLACTTSAGDELVPLEQAAKIAATSKRVIADAVRSGDLRAYGRQRDRAIRRADLDAWIEARAVRVEVGRDDDAIDLRVKRIERQRQRSAS